MFLKLYANDLQGIQVMETIKMHCKSISQIQSGAYAGLKVISPVEHTEGSKILISAEAKKKLLYQKYY